MTPRRFTMANRQRNSTWLDRRTALEASAFTAATAAFGCLSASTSPAWGSEARHEIGPSGWWRWRGPFGNNHAAAGASVPNQVTSENTTQLAAIPGRGHSSPIVTDSSVYLTTADKTQGVQSVVAVSNNGGLRGVFPIHRGGLPRENHRKNTEASSTLAFDGERLFATFYNGGAIRLTCLTTDGQIQWQKTVGAYNPRQYKYGYAASPLLYRDSVIVVGDFDGPAFLAALDRRSGEVIWKTDRPRATSFSSPIVAHVAGRDQLLISGGKMVASYDPGNGRTLWQAAGATTMATCGTMVWDDQRVFASGGYPKSETVCVAADGTARMVWSNNVKCYEQSMLISDDHVYAVADNGIAYCWRASDGSTMWRERLDGPFSSSPVLVGDTIHVFNESGRGYAFKATPERFQQTGESQVADQIFATPAIVDDTMYLRVANGRAGDRQELLLAVR